MKSDMELAEEAYNAYCQATGGKSLITHQRLPAFVDMRSDIQQAWVAAAKAVIKFCPSKV